jgi:hypothetical protein
VQEVSPIPIIIRSDFVAKKRVERRHPGHLERAQYIEIAQESIGDGVTVAPEADCWAREANDNLPSSNQFNELPPLSLLRAVEERLR